MRTHRLQSRRYLMCRQITSANKNSKCGDGLKLTRSRLTCPVPDKNLGASEQLFPNIDGPLPRAVIGEVSKCL